MIADAVRVDPALVSRLSRAVQEALVAEATERAKAGRPGLTRAGQEALAGDLHQHSELPVVMGGADVLDPDNLPALLVHDLHRPRTRSRRHLPNERSHDRGYQPPD